MIEFSENLIEKFKVVDISEVLPFGVQHLVFVCKGLNRNERIARNLLQSKTTGSLGGLETPIISQGEVLDVRTDSLTFGEPSSLVHEFLQDPRGISRIEGPRFFISSIDSVYLLDFQTDDLKRIPTEKETWMCFIHHLHLSQSKERLLVTSSGNETIFEYMFKNNSLTLLRKWCAWDNGFPMPTTPIEEIVNGNRKQIGIPPGQRTVFPNSSCYVDQDHILATFFHKGLFKIDLNSGICTEIYTGKYFHTVQQFKDGYIFASSKEGKIYYLKSFDYSASVLLDFTKLPGLNPATEGKEWIQSVHVLDQNKLLVVDSNRANIYIIDLLNQKYSVSPFQENLVVQEVLEY